MITLLLLSLAPVFAILVYIYFRDRYEKEPVGLIVKGFFAGVFIIFPGSFIESLISGAFHFQHPLAEAAFQAFGVAGLIEETIKFVAVWILFWFDRNFNERFDGIVYAVSVSLGFAALENVFYVLGEHSLAVGLTRAFTAVPAHAMFGIVMGFFLGLARFNLKYRAKLIVLAVILPWLLHGIYDFILMSKQEMLLFLFFPFMYFMYRYVMKRMNELNRVSPFNPNNFHYDTIEEDNTESV